VIVVQIAKLDSEADELAKHHGAIFGLLDGQQRRLDPHAHHIEPIRKGNH